MHSFFFFLDFGEKKKRCVSLFAFQKMHFFFWINFQKMHLMIFLGVLGGRLSRMLGLYLMICHLGLVFQVIGIDCYVGLVSLISSFSINLVDNGEIGLFFGFQTNG